MSNKILNIQPISNQWPMENPFLFCAHHKDNYPAGNEEQEIVGSLVGRNIGSDFSGKDGFSMYHGQSVPGFPAHPHRGFETVTITLKGLIDHFDSKGSRGRYGNGDVQWLTTGAGCQHSEMFPLIKTDDDNTAELFQVWLNLPSKDKFVEPSYKMLWYEDIPEVELKSENAKSAKVRIISGSFSSIKALEPCPSSWAADENNHVSILHFILEPGANIILPAVSKSLIRNLYFYEGNGSVIIEGKEIGSSSKIKLTGSEDVLIENGSEESKLLLLEGEPILEPVVQYGPFVMNTKQEIYEAFRDYEETEFGGWPWDRPDPVHSRETRRLALYADGSKEER